MSPSKPDPERRPLYALAVVLMVAFAALMWASRSQSLFADEWAFYVRAGDFGLDRVFESHLGNLHAISNSLYAGIFSLFGVDNYLPFRIIWAGLVVTVAALVFTFARPRVGGWAALAPAILLCGFGSGWEVLGGPLGITLTLCTAFGLGMLLALERRTTRSDVLAAILLLASLATYSAGIAWAVGATVELILRGRDGLRRAWIVAVPGVLYLAWRVYELHFHQTDLQLANVLSLPASMFNSLSSAFATLAGSFGTGGFPVTVAVDPTAGRALGVIAVAALIARFAARDRWPLDRRIWVLIAMPLTFWAAIGAEAGAPQGPAAGRYQYISAVFLVLLASQAFAGRRPGMRSGLVLAGVLAVSLAGNLTELRDAGRFLRENGEQNRAQLAGLELVRDNVPPTFGIELITNTFGPFEDMLIVTDAYLKSVDNIGSPALPLDQLAAQRENVRERVDQELISALQLNAFPAPGELSRRARDVAAGGSGPVVAVEAGDGESQARGGCVDLRTDLGGAVFSVGLAPGGFVVDQAGGPVSATPAVERIRLRRFGDRFITALPGAGLALPPSLGDQLIPIPTDPSPVPWHAELVISAPVTVCPNPGPGGR